MPVTRDLSPTKRLTVLENPLYDATSSHPPGQPSDPICQTPPLPTLLKAAPLLNPPRCQCNNIPFNVDPEKEDPISETFFTISGFQLLF